MHIYFLSYSNSHFSQVLEDGSLGKGFGYYLPKSQRQAGQVLVKSLTRGVPGYFLSSGPVDSEDQRRLACVVHVCGLRVFPHNYYVAFLW